MDAYFRCGTKSSITGKKIHPNNEKYAEDMFLFGVMHDLGYEFM